MKGGGFVGVEGCNVALKVFFAHNNVFHWHQSATLRFRDFQGSVLENLVLETSLGFGFRKLGP